MHQFDSVYSYGCCQVHLRVLRYFKTGLSYNADFYFFSSAYVDIVEKQNEFSIEFGSLFYVSKQKFHRLYLEVYCETLS